MYVGHINYIVDGNDVKRCEVCGNTRLNDSPKKKDISVELICSKGKIKLLNKCEVLGRMGTIGTDIITDKDFPSVSRRHLKIEKKDGGLYVKDIGSKFGSWINKEKMELNKEYKIKDGDYIRMANLIFEVRIK